MYLLNVFALKLTTAQLILLGQQQPPANTPTNPFGGGMIPFLVVIGVVFYFMVLRPENQKRSEQDKMRKDLKKNDRIVTIGGIHGTVVSAPAEGDEVTIKLDENSPTRMRISRAAVQTVVTNKENGTKEA